MFQKFIYLPSGPYIQHLINDQLNLGNATHPFHNIVSHEICFRRNILKILLETGKCWRFANLEKSEN